MARFAEVILDVPHGQIDRFFDYLIPDEMQGFIKEGMRVRVPFARGTRTGYVIGLKEFSSLKKIKPIEKILPGPFLDEEQLHLVEWLRDNYFCFYITAIRTVFPLDMLESRIKRTAMVYIELLDENWEPDLKNAPGQRKVWEFLKSCEQGISIKEIQDKTGVSVSTIKAMEKKNLIRIEKMILGKDPLPALLKEVINNNGQTDDGEECWKIEEAEKKQKKIVWKKRPYQSTFSCYSLLLKKCLQADQTAMVFVPEIYLLKEVLKICYQLAGDEIAVFHSGLSPAEKYSQWWKVKNGQAKIIIGSRSAAFLPVSKLGLIIVHNEDSSSYVQQEHPKYQIQDILEKKSEYHDSSLVLCSSSPRVSSYHKALDQEFVFVKTTNRKTIPYTVQVVDMREEFSRGNVSIFSQKLQEVIKKEPPENKKVLLYINRRGYAPFLLCRSCGFVFRCPRCDLTLTLHKEDATLHCHHCSYAGEWNEGCLRCQSRYLRKFGLGTERVSEEAKKLFNISDVTIIDSDRIKSEQELKEKILHVENSAHKEILVGTQMALKRGLIRFDVVGIVSADLTLNLPYYGASEETYQQIIQGQEMLQPDGKLIIQSYDPANFSIRTAAEDDYETFAEKELRYRRMHRYPPYYELLIFTFNHGKEKTVSQGARKFASCVQKLALPDLEVLGPCPGVMPKVKGKYNWQVSLRSQKRESLHALIEKTRSTVNALVSEGIRVNLDINPRRMV